MLALGKGEALLAQTQAGDVPEAGAEMFACGFAQMRAKTDSRVATTNEIDEGKLFNAQFTGIQGYAEQEDSDACEAFVAGGMSRLGRNESPPAWFAGCWHPPK